MLPPRPLTTSEVQALHQRVVAHLEAVKLGEEASPRLGEEDLKTLINIVE